ncbi:MerR family transcriptional regulator [Bacillus subtilis]|uniref:MerR family transcriptional regulator n=2 Tax=Bacillaceae TaxID=186817 RepID=UPI000CDE3229|nr:MerR family transcriptional regulator [Bacillus subtilis]AXC53661.1 MerR family transcriptional regulator [Bacillus spizizenii]MDK1005279.1 MerR family transcriptional regulator [Bacillus subtilis]POX32262.1 MerR family transcriptional regulator [Bacillus sp. Ru63]QUG81900.1 MerR family transcriptional regulator [Bacillus subtilis]
MSDKLEIDPLLDIELLKKLVVGIGEVSDITNVATRKIRYWEEKGIIESIKDSEGSTRKYNYLNIKKILLINELLEEGFTLDAAATKVQKRMDTINDIFKKLSDLT